MPSPEKENDVELANPGMVVDPQRTALVITDLQNDFLSPGGIAWSLVEDSLAENNTLENLESLLRAARRHRLPVFLSPHYYYPTDRAWTSPGGAVEELMHQLGLFARQGPLTLDRFAGSGADWPERFKPYLEDGETVVASPHKVYGTSSNDLALQLRKRRIEKIILAGPAGNLCVEAHLRDFLEQGLEVAMVRDATAGARNEEGDGYRAALVNFRALAHALWTTRETVQYVEAAADAQSASRKADPASQRAG
jgi:nicotinamidase-related amidase